MVRRPRPPGRDGGGRRPHGVSAHRSLHPAAESGKDSFKTPSRSREWDELTATREAYQRKIEMAKLKISKLAEDNKNISDDIEKKRKALSGRRAKGTVKKKKEISRLMERWLLKVNVETTKLNCVKAKHRKVKDKINEIRRENILTVSQMDKMKEECRRTESEVSAMEDRIQGFREKIERRDRRFQKQVSKFEHEIASVTSSSRALRESIEARQEAGTRKMNSPMLSGDDRSQDARLAGNLSRAQETTLKNELKASRWDIARETVRLRRGTMQLKTYNEGFKYLKEDTGAASTEDLVNIFIQREEDNFRLYEHVSALGKEIDDLERLASMEQDSLDKYRSCDTGSNASSRILSNLEDRVKTAEGQLEERLKQAEASSALLRATRNAVGVLFSKLKCSSRLVDLLDDQLTGKSERVASRIGKRTIDFSQPSSRHLSGIATSAISESTSDSSEKKSNEKEDEIAREPSTASDPMKVNSLQKLRKSTRHINRLRRDMSLGGLSDAGSVLTRAESENERFDVTDYNLIQCLGVIEQRANELIMHYALQMKKRGEDTSFLNPLASAAKGDDGADRTVMPSKLPSKDDDMWSDDDESDDDLRPLTYAELHDKVSNKQSERRRKENKISARTQKKAAHHEANSSSIMHVKTQGARIYGTVLAQNSPKSAAREIRRSDTVPSGH